MTLSDTEFRSLLGRFASGVTVLTARDADGRLHGMTVSAFCSLSLDPPLVLACVEKSASLLSVLTETRHFGVSILSEAQESLSKRFADSSLDARFDGVPHHLGRHGIPLLSGAVGTMVCERYAQHDGGDHVILIGRIDDSASHAGMPLLYFRGGYGRLDR